MAGGVDLHTTGIVLGPEEKALSIHRVSQALDVKVHSNVATASRVLQSEPSANFMSRFTIPKSPLWSDSSHLS